MDVTFKHPFTMLVSGPTGVGKTVFVQKFLQAPLFDVPPQRIVWAYGEWQESYDRFPYTYVKGLTDIDDVMSQVKGPQVLVVDDLMGEDTEILQKWFTKKSHHHDTSVIYIVQNLFDKQQRTISLNAHYLVLFKNPRDASQIGVLARQMYPSRSKYMQEAYEDATSTPRSYLLVDLKPDTPEALRLRSNILPQEEPPIVYVQKV
ncbi:hypothetical protein SNE40_002192 [Patella caerulea]|uniref:Uncharacterized protein n=1 Tax=Patella caerulea TaxID=87958 RepID=A0AAN8QDD4_PATCE